MRANATVAGHCPMGCGATLFLGDGGHVTCSLLGCPRPTAADELLHLDTEHYVVFDERSFTVEHPPRERIEGSMHECQLHLAIRELDGPPVAPGRYRATPHGVDGYSESFRSDAIGWEFERIEEPQRP